MRRSHASVIGYPVGGSYQSVSFSGTTARTSSGVGSQTYWVALYADQDCHIAFGGSSVEAAATDFFLPASQFVALNIRPGQYIAALQNSAAGTLHVSELDH